MTKLDEIVANKKLEVACAQKTTPLAALERQLKGRLPVRDFRGAITRRGNLSLIAEFKRSSPSAGKIQAGADPIGVAQAYAKAGACALSILTDEKFFSGSLKDLAAVKEKVVLPILRKDFILEEYQVVESAAWGADAVLLIVKILKEPQLTRLLELAKDLKLEALVEVHSEGELKCALSCGGQIIGINNRDLDTFTVDLKVTEQLIREVEPDRTVVSESGIRSRQDVEYMERLGAHAVLIGEELISSPDIEKRIKELMGW